jgi:DNA polymerase-1
VTPAFDTFKEIWCVDFEFGYTNAGPANLTPPGELQAPVCLVAWELRSRRKIKLWRNDFAATPPYSTGPESLFIAFFANAEIKCHLVLGWPVPAHVLDLWVEYRNMTNAIGFNGGRKLINVLARYGLSSIGADEKGEMQELAMHIGAGGSYTEEQRAALLDYCETDVEALATAAEDGAAD